MTRTTSITAALAAGLALAACNQAANKAPAAPPPPVAAAPAAPVPAEAPPAPHVRVENAIVEPAQLGVALDVATTHRIAAGYWRAMVSTDGAPPREALACESGRPSPAPDPASCPTVTLNTTHTGGLAYSQTCHMGQGEMQLSAHSEGDYTSWYSSQIRIRATREGREIIRNMHSESTFIGPCPAGAAAQAAPAAGVAAPLAAPTAAPARYEEATGTSTQSSDTQTDAPSDDSGDK